MSIGGGFNTVGKDIGGGGGDFMDSVTDPLGKNAAADATTEAGRLQAAAYGKGIDEQRRQFDAVQALLAPYVGAGTNALPGLTEASSLTGFGDRLSAILGSDALKPLVDERMKAVTNQLGQSGLLRSGAAVREAANVPTDLALSIEDALFGRQANLVNLGQSSAVGQANIGSDLSGHIAQLLGQQGEALAGGIIGGQQARAAMTGTLINAGANVGAAALFFSDPRLKLNMEKIGQIGPLGFYEWDWREEVRDMVGCEMSLGFSADEVEEHFPQHIAKVRGFKVIDYPALTDELRARYMQAEG